MLVADQLSKYWVLNGLELPKVGSIALLPFLNFTMVWNEGISMGLPLGETVGKWGIIVITSGISVWLFNWARKSEDKLEAIGLATIFGGAVGNIIDRFLHGAVVDFIHLHAGGYDFYVFNVADSAVTIGVILLLIDGLRDGSKSPKKASKGIETESQSAVSPKGEE